TPPPPPPPALGPDEWLLGFADFDAKKSSVGQNLASMEATVCFGSGDAAATASATILPQSGGEVRLRLALKSASADEAASRPELWKLRLDLIPRDPRLAATWQPPPTLRRLLLWKPALQTTNQAKASLSIEFRLPAAARLFWPAASAPGDAASAQASLEVPAGRQAVADYQLRLVTLKASTSADGGPLQGCLRLELVGDLGDTGRRAISLPAGGLGSVDGEVLEVQLSAVDLGQLRLCRISADSREASGAWNCDRLIAARLGPGFSVTDFICCDWLRPRGEPDGRAERTLRPDEPLTEDDDLEGIQEDARKLIDAITEQAAKRVEELHEGNAVGSEKKSDSNWQLTLSSGEKGCQPDTEISLVICGDRGESDVYEIKKAKQRLRLFPDCDMEFPLRLVRSQIGELYKLRLQMSESAGDEWFVKEITLEHLTPDFELLRCPVNRWFSRLREPFEVVHEVLLIEHLK
uniref:PLAT domain-containing protein n=1 Tax=Macrostomum lignano TaxID=282301 RepID=A0A1I8J1M3_9PLAT